MPGLLCRARRGPRTPRPSGPTRPCSLRTPRSPAKGAWLTLLVPPPRSWPGFGVPAHTKCRRRCEQGARVHSRSSAPVGIFLAAPSVQMQTPGWTTRPPPQCSKGPVRLAVPAPQAERARAVPGSARRSRVSFPSALISFNRLKHRTQASSKRLSKSGVWLELEAHVNQACGWAGWALS